MHARSKRNKSPRLLPLVEEWLASFGKEKAQTLRADSDDLAAELIRIRSLMKRTRQEKGIPTGEVATSERTTSPRAQDAESDINVESRRRIDTPTYYFSDDGDCVSPLAGTKRVTDGMAYQNWNDIGHDTDLSSLETGSYARQPAYISPDFGQGEDDSSYYSKQSDRDGASSHTSRTSDEPLNRAPSAAFSVSASSSHTVKASDEQVNKGPAGVFSFSAASAVPSRLHIRKDVNRGHKTTDGDDRSWVSCTVHTIGSSSKGGPSGSVPPVPAIPSRWASPAADSDDDIDPRARRARNAPPKAGSRSNAPSSVYSTDERAVRYTESKSATSNASPKSYAPSSVYSTDERRPVNGNGKAAQQGNNYDDVSYYSYGECSGDDEETLRGLSKRVETISFTNPFSKSASRTSNFRRKQTSPPVSPGTKVQDRDMAIVFTNPFSKLGSAAASQTGSSRRKRSSPPISPGTKVHDAEDRDDVIRPDDSISCVYERSHQSGR
jgi:hypothetical protein